MFYKYYVYLILKICHFLEHKFLKKGVYKI